LREAFMPRRIAIVEDEPAIRENYADALKRHGYDVSTYPDRATATHAFASRLPDLVLIDVGLGAEIDGGFALCRDLRAMSSTLPVIFLTARDSDFDVVSGLRMGADDYVPKTVSLPNLIARIAALFRRADLANSPSSQEDLLLRGPLSLDLKRMTVRWNDHPIELTVTELWMVHALARYPGHVKDRDALMRDANIVVDDGTITSHIKRIRRKFQSVDPRFDAIETVYGMGYRWHAQA
jgi:two-component system OmpR family response regulator